MTRLLLAALVLLSIPVRAQDVFVPPVPRGIARDGEIRTPKRPIPFPSDKQWIRLRSARFDLVSSANPIRTRDIAADLDTLASALMRANPRFAPASSPATVFVFERRRESQPYFDLLFARENARATGAYVRHDGGGTMFIDASRHIERVAMHELIHDLLRQQDVMPPLWLEEGLAEYFSNAEVRDGRVRAGLPIKEHVVLLRQKPPMPLAQVFAMKADMPAAASTAFYAQSWAAVDYLIAAQDEETFFRFLRDVEGGTPVADALRVHYKLAINEMESSMRRPRIPRMIVLEGTPSVAANATPLDRATLLFELGSFLTHVSGAEAEAKRHFDEALRVDPQHARTLATIGEYERAVAAAPNDPIVHLVYAESLLATATGAFAGVFVVDPAEAPQFRKARSLAEHALRIDGDEARTRGVIGTTYLIESDIAPGIAHLERALALAPHRTDFALNLYAMYLRSGARAKADALFATHFENARDKQTIFAARNVLVATETERANALAQAGKLEEAAAMVRELAALTPDAMARRDLESQAEKLLETASINNEILTYNRAIELTNKGKDREALAVLDELLKTARDATVVGDATKLRNELRKRR